jgi:hypothetical protein
MKRLFTTFVAVLAVVASLGTTPAWAGDAPSNDLIGDATDITGLPFVDAVDTRAAAADGPRFCSRSNGHSVFYRFRSLTDVRMQAATLGSDYDTVLSVLRGRVRHLEKVACSDDAYESQSVVHFRADAGVRYLIQVSSYGGNRGGDLAFSLQALPLPALVMDSEITGGAMDIVSGDVTLEGTLACSNPSAALIAGELRQRRNDLYIARAHFWETVRCGDPAAWSIQPEAQNDISFAGGDAKFVFTIWAYDGTTWGTLEGTQVITLST